MPPSPRALIERARRRRAARSRRASPLECRRPRCAGRGEAC